VEQGTEENLDVVREDMQLAVVAPVEEVPTPALLAAERVIAMQGKEGAGADPTHTDHGPIAAIADVYAERCHLLAA
jgi:hypothetical protein